MSDDDQKNKIQDDTTPVIPVSETQPESSEGEASTELSQDSSDVIASSQSDETLEDDKVKESVKDDKTENTPPDEAEAAEESAKEEKTEEPMDAAVESVNSDVIDSTDTSDESDTQSPAESSEPADPSAAPQDDNAVSQDDVKEERKPVIASTEDPNAKWYVVHTFAGHENKVLTNLKQRVESEHLENRIFDILVPTQDKIEIRGGKKETVKEKIFPGYILVKMILDDNSWLTVRTTQGVTSFIGAGNKPIPISEAEVNSIVKFTTQGAAPTFKDVFMVDDTVKIVDGPFSDFIGKVDSVDKEKGRVRVLVSIFGRETPVELDFLQVQKL